MVAMMFKKVRSSSKTSASLNTLRRRLVSTSRNYFFSHWQQQQPFWEYLIAVRDLPTIYHIIFFISVTNSKDYFLLVMINITFKMYSNGLFWLLPRLAKNWQSWKHWRFILPSQLVIIVELGQGKNKVQNTARNYFSAF